MAVQRQGNNTATTTTTYLPHAVERTDNIEHELGNTSRTSTTKEKTTSSINTINSLSDLRPATEVNFRTVKKVDAVTKQEVQILHTSKETRQLREAIQT